MTNLRIRSAGPLRGSVRLAGDLHIGQQALVWAALADGPCLISGLGDRVDHRLLCTALRAMGVPIASTPAGLRVAGVGLRGLSLPQGALLAGASTTTLEILTALLCGQHFGTRIEATGPALAHSLRTLIAPLRARGAHVAGKVGEDGDVRAPVAVAPLLAGELLREVEIEIPDGDATTKLGLLLTGLYARGLSVVSEGLLSRDHAERALMALGAPIETHGPVTLLDSSGVAPSWGGFEWQVPGDFTLACFVIAAALSVPGSDVRLEGIGLNRSRTAFLDVMRHAGALIEVIPKGDLAGNEPIADLRVRSCRLRSAKIAGELAFRVSDEVMALAALAPCLGARLGVRDLLPARSRTPDSLRAMGQLLREAGFECTDYADGFDLEPGIQRRPFQLPDDAGAELMLLGLVLALSAPGETCIAHAEQLDALYPELIGTLASLGASIVREIFGPMSIRSVRSNRSSGKPVVAIDGPAGAGKSTAATKLALRLGYVLVDTGALYRGAALSAFERGMDWEDGSALGALIDQLAFSFERDAEGTARLFVDGVDRSADIRTPHISTGASRVSRHHDVRRALLGLQRRLGAAGGVVLEGRDIGTVVFPDAEVKVFLTASDQARAERRYAELRQAGHELELEQVLKETRERDRLDSERDIAPMRPADDAVVLDTDGLSLDQVIDKLEALVKQRMS